MKRIQIIGYGGSGKTTLANNLSKVLNIDHYEPDAFFWLPNWQAKDQQKFQKEIMDIIQKDSWVLCASYARQLNAAISRQADTIVVLSFPFRVILFRVVKRSLGRIIFREKIWETNYEKLSDFLFSPTKSTLWVTVKNFKANGRKKYLKKAVNLGFEDKIVEFNHPRVVKTWLKNL